MAMAFYIIFIIVSILYSLLVISIIFFLVGSIIADIQASGVPYVPSYTTDLQRMKEKLHLDEKKTMIDLGCGDGKALRFFVKNFGITNATGYDFNLPAILFGKLVNKRLKIDNITLKRGDFLKVDISKYDYVYLYLLTAYLEKIEDFVFENMGDDAIIISNTFRFKKHEPVEVIQNENGRDRILIYRKN